MPPLDETAHADVLALLAEILPRMTFRPEISATSAWSAALAPSVSAMQPRPWICILAIGFGAFCGPGSVSSTFAPTPDGAAAKTVQLLRPFSWT